MILDLHNKFMGELRSLNSSISISKMARSNRGVNRTLCHSKTERDYWDHQWVIHGIVSLHYPVGFAPRLTSKSGDPNKRSLTLPSWSEAKSSNLTFSLLSVSCGCNAAQFLINLWQVSWVVKPEGTSTTIEPSIKPEGSSCRGSWCHWPTSMQYAVDLLSRSDARDVGLASASQRSGSMAFLCNGTIENGIRDTTFQRNQKDFLHNIDNFHIINYNTGVPIQLNRQPTIC